MPILQPLKAGLKKTFSVEAAKFLFFFVFSELLSAESYELLRCEASSKKFDGQSRPYSFRLAHVASMA